eukprot:793315-Rhodomonas_salina.2
MRGRGKEEWRSGVSDVQSGCGERHADAGRAGQPKGNALHETGCYQLQLDFAHGLSLHVCDWEYKLMRCMSHEIW